MGILICDKKGRPNNKPSVIKSNKHDVENNSTNETEKNNNNNNVNANLPLREQPTNEKLDIKEENNTVKEGSDDKQVVTLDSKVFIAKGNNDPNKLYIKKKNIRSWFFRYSIFSQAKVFIKIFRNESYKEIAHKSKRRRRKFNE